MTPQRATRFVLSDGKDPDALAAMERDWEDMLKEPANLAAFDRAVQNLADAVDERVYQQLIADLMN